MKNEQVWKDLVGKTVVYCELGWTVYGPPHEFAPDEAKVIDYREGYVKLSNPSFTRPLWKGVNGLKYLFTPSEPGSAENSQETATLSLSK